MSLRKSAGGAATALLGKQTAPKNIGYDAVIVLVPVGTVIATKTLALTESTWLDAINAAVGTRFIVLPIFKEMESTPEDDVVWTSSLGAQEDVRDGKDTVNHSVIVSPFVMSQLRGLNGIDWKDYIFSSNGFIKGTSVDDVEFSPFSIDRFKVGKELKATGDTPALVPVSITYADPTEWSNRPAFVEPLREGLSEPWNPRDLKDPKANTSLITNESIAGFDIYVEGYDEVPTEGLPKESFIILDALGVEIAIDSATESTPGQYAVLATIAPGTIKAGVAPVGHAGALQGQAGLESDLQTLTIA